MSGQHLSSFRADGSGADSPAAVEALLRSPAGAALEPITRQYLVLAWAVESAARSVGPSAAAFAALNEDCGTVHLPELFDLLPAVPDRVNHLCNLLARSCATLEPARPVHLRGRLVSLEGGDGVGKTTLARLLADELTERGLPVVATRALGGAGGSALDLRRLILDPDLHWSPFAEALLTVSVYRETFMRVVFPALQSGHHVVCDRLLDTALVYLADEAAGVDASVVRQLYDILVGDVAPGLEPDVTFLLDLPYEVAVSRRGQRDSSRPDRNEAKGEDFHRRVFENYRRLAETSPRFVQLDATISPPELVRSMADIVAERAEEMAA